MPTFTPHLEALLQHDMDLIRVKVLEMATLDEQALACAFQAFQTRDRQLAYSVILRDQNVDALETELDRLCLEFIVRHQPAAGPLRFVYSASKVVNDLERVGDYAESIAREVLVLSSMSFDVPTDRFSEIANLAIPMLHNAVRAFIDGNPDLARTTMACEPRVNKVRDGLGVDLVEWRAQGRLPLEALPALMTIGRRFERVSDQATNICEEALYSATGEYLRHLPREGFRVLFVDSANACLSQMAEAIGNGLGAKRFSFGSAGIVAAPAIEPYTVRFLAEKGIDILHAAPKSIEQFSQKEQTQVVVALCPEARRVLPEKPAKTVGLDWSVADPSQARGTPDEIRTAYQAAFDTLTGLIRELVQAILGNDAQRVHEQINPLQ